MQHHALYIGAGIDNIPMKYCDWIHIFTCMDSQPYSEFGVQQSGKINIYGHDEFYRPDFIENVNKSYYNIGYELHDPINGNIRCYSNGTQSIFYYMNTSIPDHHNQVKIPFSEIDSVIVSGHDPDCIFLKYTTKRLSFIGVEGTSFDKIENDSTNTLVQCLHNGKYCFFFYNYFFLHKDGTFREFLFWDDFMNYYYKLCAMN